MHVLSFVTDKDYYWIRNKDVYLNYNHQILDTEYVIKGHLTLLAGRYVDYRAFLKNIKSLKTSEVTMLQVSKNIKYMYSSHSNSHCTSTCWCVIINIVWLFHVTLSVKISLLLFLQREAEKRNEGIRNRSQNNSVGICRHCRPHRLLSSSKAAGGILNYLLKHLVDLWEQY